MFGILELLKDKFTHALTVITYEHHEVHDGNMFSLNALNDALADDGTLEIVLTIPEGKVESHLIYEMENNGAANLLISEDPTGITGGTSKTPLNDNRTSSKASVNSAVVDPTSITDDGLTLREWIRGLGVGVNKTPGLTRGERELVLKPGSSYLFRVTNISGGVTEASINLIWYEHTPKS